MARVILKELHMYCRELSYEDDAGSFCITVEDSPRGGELLVWELDIPGDLQRRTQVIQVLPLALAQITRLKLVLMEGTRC